MYLRLLLFCLSGTFFWRMANRLLSILCGFLAKHLCSAIFVSSRSLEEIRQNELKVWLFRLPAIHIDQDSKSVEVKIGNVINAWAFYHPNSGCTLCRKPPEKPLVSENHRLFFPTKNFSNSLHTSSTWEKKLTPWMNTSPTQTLALYILQEGKTVTEMYAPGIKSATPLPGWSMAKSVMNAIAGISLRRGIIDLHEKLPAHTWQGNKDPRDQISLHHLLQMSSGLPWTEPYWWDSDVTRMLFDSEDVSHIITSKAYGQTPGSSWQYASGTTNVISKVLRHKLGEDYHLFPYRELFAPLDMQTALLETDACGNFVGSSYMLASARDWARFGQLYLQDGIWEGKRVLPAGWVKYSTTPVASAPGRAYGAHFWLNLGEEGKPETRKMPDAPSDVFYASGFGGQRILVVLKCRPSGQ